MCPSCVTIKTCTPSYVFAFVQEIIQPPTTGAPPYGRIFRTGVDIIFLNYVFVYMKNWRRGAACGVGKGTGYCVDGLKFNNKWALCAKREKGE